MRLHLTVDSSGLGLPWGKPIPLVAPGFIVSSHFIASTLVALKSYHFLSLDILERTLQLTWFLQQFDETSLVLILL